MQMTNGRKKEKAERKKRNDMCRSKGERASATLTLNGSEESNE